MLFVIFGDKKLKKKEKEILQEKIGCIKEYDFLEFHNLPSFKDKLLKENFKGIYFNMSEHKDRIYVSEKMMNEINVGCQKIVLTRSSKHDFIFDVEPSLIIKWKDLKDIKFNTDDEGILCVVKSIKKPDSRFVMFLKRLICYLPLIGKSIQTASQIYQSKGMKF